jgi:uncharacterized membrane protein YgcG
MRRALSCLGLLLALLSCVSVPARAEESVLSFESRVRVLPNGSLDVTETLRVKVEGKTFRHGVFRDFPTDYRDRLGNAVRVGFAVKAVRIDNAPGDWFEEPAPGGRRVYMGDRKRLLPRGVHRFELNYVTSRQVGFFADHDELGWNVTGSGWSVTLDKVRVVIEPPGQVLESAAWTGPPGSRESAAQEFREHGKVIWQTTRALDPGEGLTVAVSWPKGLVHEPTAQDQAAEILAGDAPALAALAGLAAVFVYYLLAWTLVGRDPKKGPIVPLFAPPDGLSAAACRRVWRLGCDRACLAATVLALAAKKALTISGQDARTLTATGQVPADLCPDERVVLANLFPLGAGSLELGAPDKAVRNAQAALVKTLESGAARDAFRANRQWLALGLGITALTLGAIVLCLPPGDRQVQAGFIGVWLTGWTVAVWKLSARVRDGFAAGFFRGLGALLVALPFLAGEAFGLFLLAQAMGGAAALLFLASACLGALFSHLLKAPSVAGRRLMDRIEGFRLFLSVAEGPRLAALNPPDMTPELFEKFLPYALALDVESAWADRFAARLAAAGQDPGSYRPSWGAAGFGHGGVRGLSTGLASGLAGGLSASASAPGSRSAFGGGGGGGSGSGGGGGGGGGW